MHLVPLKTWVLSSYMRRWYKDSCGVLCVWEDYNVLTADWMCMQIYKFCASFSCQWSNSVLSANPNKSVSDLNGHSFQASQVHMRLFTYPSQRSTFFWFQWYYFSLFPLSYFCVSFTDFTSFVQSININGCKCSQIISFLFQISPNGLSHQLP